MRCKRIVTALLALLLMTVLGLPALGNSARFYWEGQDVSGAFVTGEDCPIVVEKEVLTFDIQELPQHSYGSEADFQQYSAKVTAEYTFYNPADYTVTATLLFPFGNLPDYTQISEYHEGEGYRYFYPENLSSFRVAVNGQPIDAVLRHTFTDLDYHFDQNEGTAGYFAFDVHENLARLIDGYAEDPFYSPDLPVTKYIYVQTEGVGGGDHTSLSLPAGGTVPSKFIVPRHNEILEENGRGEVYFWITHVDPFVFYVINETDPPTWEIKDDLAEWETKEAEGYTTLVSKEKMTLEDLACSAWREASGISRTDWYNAMITAFYHCELGFNLIDGEGTQLDYQFAQTLDISEFLMRWYEYEITLAPGERIVNTVTAPIYPAINEFTDPVTYTYTYLLSPAKTWADFGPLDIQINTPYTLMDANLENFKETGTGYSLSLGGLPEGELEFSLSPNPDAKPELTQVPELSVSEPTSGAKPWVLGVILLIAAALCAALWGYRKTRKHPKQ